MSRITGTLGRPVQGISQQPNNIRIAGQCEESVNLRPDMVRGLTTRTGASWIKSLPFTPDIRDKWLHYSRDEVEEYFINIPYHKANGIKIVDKDGNVCNVTSSEMDSVLDYIYGSGEFADVQGLLTNVTIGDTTIIANNQVKVQPSGLKSPSNKHIAVVYCQYMEYSQTQKIFIDGKPAASYTSPDGSVQAHKAEVDTTYVAEKLLKVLNETPPALATDTVACKEYNIGGGRFKGIPLSELPPYKDIVSFYNETRKTNITGNIGVGDDPNIRNYVVLGPSYGSNSAGDVIRVTYYDSSGTSTEGFEAVQKGNTIWLWKKDGSNFTIRTEDGADGGNLIAVKDSVSDVSKLPPSAPADMIVKVKPKGGNVSEEFFLKSTWNNEDGTDLQWVECAAPDIELGFNVTTMPIQLVRETYKPSGSDFSINFIDWAIREVGNEKNNPQPAFVDDYISSVSLLQNRLLLSASETSVLSRSSEFFNFFKTTTQSILDTDPYEVYSDSTEVVALKNPIPFNGDILFFTETAQMSLSGADVISPNKPTPLRQVSSFESQSNAKPVAAGENIFFAFDYGRFTGIREFFTDSITDTKRARPITDHVNHLLKGKVHHMATSTSINTLAVVCEDKSTVFMYDWMWQGSDKVQSAWGKWQFEEGTVVHYFEFSRSNLYMIYTRNGVTSLVKFDMGDKPDDLGGNAEGLSFALDHKKMVEFNLVDGVFEASDTDLDNLLGLTDNSLITGVQATGFTEDIGSPVELLHRDGKYVLDLNTSDIPNGHVKVDVLTGLRINLKYIPSNPYAKDQDGTARADFDRLQVGRLSLNYESAGICEARIQTNSGHDRKEQLTPRVIGNINNTVGFSRPMGGTYRISVRNRANQYWLTLTSSSHIPLQIREVEFDGTYSRRGRTI